jgi:two-component system sensor histidine kinase UhpB
MIPGLLAWHDSREAMRRFEARREGEARRIAQSLHDEAGQFLAAVQIALQGLRPHIAPAGREHLAQAECALVAAEEELRRVAHDLRPLVLDDYGLVPALRVLARRVEQRAGIRVEVLCALGERLPEEVETAIYRIAQEGLSNVVKHAGASRATLDVMRSRHRVALRVRDDGRGFDPRRVAKGSEGMGLEGVRQRVQALEGDLAIQSRPGGGAEIEVSIPLGGPACLRVS